MYRYAMGIALFLSYLSFQTQCGVACATTLTFDDIPGSGTRPVAADRYQAQGVRLGTNGRGLFVVDAAFTNTPPDALYGSFSQSGQSADAQVQINFVVPGTTTPTDMSAVSFYVIDDPTDPNPFSWSVSIYDAMGTTLQTVTGFADNVPVSFFRPQADIRRVVFTPSLDLDGIDTLTFNVPEPTSLGASFWVVLACGLRRRVRVDRESQLCGKTSANRFT